MYQFANHLQENIGALHLALANQHIGTLFKFFYILNLD